MQPAWVASLYAALGQRVCNNMFTEELCESRLVLHALDGHAKLEPPIPFLHQHITS